MLLPHAPCQSILHGSGTPGSPQNRPDAARGAGGAGGKYDTAALAAPVPPVVDVQAFYTVAARHERSVQAAIIMCNELLRNGPSPHRYHCTAECSWASPQNPQSLPTRSAFLARFCAAASAASHCCAAGTRAAVPCSWRRQQGRRRQRGHAVQHQCPHQVAAPRQPCCHRRQRTQHEACAAHQHRHPESQRCGLLGTGGWRVVASRACRFRHHRQACTSSARSAEGHASVSANNWQSRDSIQKGSTDSKQQQAAPGAAAPRPRACTSPPPACLRPHIPCRGAANTASHCASHRRCTAAANSSKSSNRELSSTSAPGRAGLSLTCSHHIWAAATPRQQSKCSGASVGVGAARPSSSRHRVASQPPLPQPARPTPPAHPPEQPVTRVRPKWVHMRRSFRISSL